MFVLLGTVYDIYKRYLNYIHCQEIMTHSAILVNSMIENSTDENSPVVNTSDEDHDKIDYEHIYFINLSRNYFNYIVLYNQYKSIFNE